MNNTRRRVDWFVVITSIVFAVSCSGGGCGGCSSLEPIPGGFPAAKRMPNAAQVRVTQSGLGKVAADPASIIGPLVGGAMNGIINFPVPASCGSTSICCPGGTPSPTCGPIQIDLVKRPTDPARLVLAPAQGQSRLDVTVRARVKTQMDLAVSASGLSCNVNLDTARGSTPDITIATQVHFTQDATTGTTRVSATNSTVSLEDADISLNGNFACTIASALFIGTVRGQLETQVATVLEDQINGATCAACASGQVSECNSPFATACTNNVCQVGNRCLQETGLQGRARGFNIFGSFSPGTTGAIDLYEILGGYATSNGNGLALGMLGGMQAAGTARDRCGPAATEPAVVTNTVQSNFFKDNNIRPDTNAAFDVGIGVHKSQLDRFAWAGYDGGLLCLTIGHSFAAQLSTDTLALLSRSLGKLVETNSPMAVGLRPQAPPTITLGKNIFTDDGMGNKTLTEPLLDLRFAALELDFFAAVDDQYIRVFTVVSDVHLPIGLQATGMGTLVPVFGDVADAFTNLSVKNADGVTETPAELAALFPALLGVVLPQLSGGLSPISLPTIGGLNLAVTDVTAVDNNSFLAIFANLVVTAPARPVETTVGIAGVTEPSDAVAGDPKQWKGKQGPAVKLDLGGNASGLEWSYRIDDGLWSPWSTNAHPTLAPAAFWLPGDHHVDVVSRQIGEPSTIDLTPERLEIPLGTGVELGNGKHVRNGPGNAFHGQAGGAGCGCDSSGGATGAAPFALVLLMIMLPLRRVRRQLVRHAKRFGAVVWITAIAALPGCSCGSDADCGNAACLPGDLEHGSLGRFTSIAGDDTRVVVATYDQGLGDLVAIDATDPTKLSMTVVDGVPSDVTPTHAKDTYRGGIEEAGPNVGAWTSVALSGGHAKIAYQDREAFALKYAHETDRDHWASYVVDAPGDTETIGEYTSMIVDASGHPAIAYLAIGLDDGAGHRATELRLARAGSAEPAGETDWSVHVIATAPGSCAGLCTAGTACVAGAAAGDPETCAAITADCPAACASGDACVAGSCVTPLADPKIDDIPGGTGLFVNLLLLPDGRLAATYYDRTQRALVLATETATDSSEFAETTLDAVTPGDRGMWASSVVDGSGTVHVAYQDALGDQLMYTTFSGTPGVPEIIDDGQRAGDRTHPVGAASSIYLVSGSPAVVYQDGLTADVYLATRSGSGWANTAIATGPLLDGLSISATTSHTGIPYVAWGAIDPHATPLGTVVVETP